MGEILFLGIWMAVAVAMYIISFQFPAIKIDKSGGGGVFPRIVITLFVILLAIRIIQIIATKETKKKFAFLEIFKGPSLVYLVATTVYFLSCKAVGFILMTVVYLIGMILFCYKAAEGNLPSVKKIVIICVCVIIGVVAFAWLFSARLQVLLPKGILGF
ncbi:MAG: tripartite tricarboxylate transporter TctB family protein [Spirochaetales bacterium]|nr:tripartite tricarboxylate transporter TctB family protein [Spirochaetales bacterium]